MKESIEYYLDEAQITKKNNTILKSYEKASKELDSLRTLEKIDHPQTLAICEEAKKTIVDNINNQKKAILEVHVVQSFDFKQAEEKAALMNKALTYFDKDIIEKIDIASFEQTISDSKKRYEEMKGEQKEEFLADMKKDPKAIAQLLKGQNKDDILGLIEEAKNNIGGSGKIDIEEKKVGNINGNVGGNVNMGNENINIDGKNDNGSGTNIQNRQLGDITGNVGGDVILGDKNYNIQFNNNPFENDIIEGIAGDNTDDGLKYDDLSPEEKEKMKEKLAKAMKMKQEKYLKEMPGLMQSLMEKEEYQNPNAEKKEEIEKIMKNTQADFELKIKEQMIAEAKD